KGHKNSMSFSANLEKGIFQCFGCGAKGNVLDFAAMMQKVDPLNGSALREVAIELRKTFCPESTLPPKAARRDPVVANSSQQSIKPAIVNPRLDFELKGLDANHPYLTERGF